MEPRRRERTVQLMRYEDDVPNIMLGSCIPRPRKEEVKIERTSFAIIFMRPAVIFTASVLLFALSLGSAGYSVLRGNNSIAAPIVMLQENDNNALREFNYGVQASLSQPNFFTETRNTFIEQKLSFIEANLSEMTISYYENGEVVATSTILSKGREGSWWETPSGLYQIETKEKNHFSSFGQVYQRWSMAFQGNFFIHGWPYYGDGTPVPEGFSGGCIRLSDADAERFYNLASVGTPVLVHEKDFENDGFLYEPKVPEIGAVHYLIGDLKSSTILASSDTDTQVSIASLTKLMTALIATEYINLDKTVRIGEVDVKTSVPRLTAGTQVSMYGLLQLLLVESSNEAANVIADQIGRERFVELMNEKAESLGLTNTKFVDPSGLGEGNVSTLGDLLRLAQYLYNNRSFVLHLTADEDITTLYTKANFGALNNFNLIEGDDTFIGGKVGQTLAAGQTSVTFHKMTIDGEERVLAVIVLGSADRDGDVSLLLDYVVERFGE